MSQDPETQYRHDLLTRGICLSRCEKELQQLDSETLASLNIEKFEYNNWPPAQWPSQTFRNDDVFRKKFGKIINICMNRRLKNEYNLTGYTDIEYCDTNRDNHRDLDALDIGFAVLVGFILICVVISSFYDFILKRRENSKLDHHFTTKRISRTQSVMLSFSFYRNWKKLVAPRPPDDHKPFHAWKVFFSVITTSVHVMGFSINKPGINKYFFENEINSLFINFVSSAAIATIGFFVITGFLMAYGFFSAIDHNPISMKIKLIFFVIRRYLR